MAGGDLRDRGSIAGRRWLGLCAAALLLAACSSSNTERADVADEPPPIEPQPTTPVEVQPTGPFKAADIMRALSDKSFNYNKGSRSGVVRYSSDGTFSYNETGKGEGSGIWQASDGKLCEAFDPTSFLPKGSRSECHPFTASGGGYSAGSTRLTPT